MQLSVYSDYAVRVLMQTALRRPERITVAEVAETFGISRHHLVKVVHDLGRAGYLATQRGIGGGFTLARAPETIRLGDIVRLGEESDTVINCREDKNRLCRLMPICPLKQVLDEAAGAFFRVLDHYTLADLVRRPTRLRQALGIIPAPILAPSRGRYPHAELEFEI
ncbi:MAG TPA: Rrf2 family transcriptional regulator [Verrucomicrobiae bacterium]|nr:Rrf2 family transcriptional regulator [Verrucomicrobiae bacterium]